MESRASDPFVDLSRRILRSIRGQQSQRSFSRRLGYKGNPVAAWEAGRRHPSAVAVMGALGRKGCDLEASFAAFDGTYSPRGFGTTELADWMDHVRGKRKIQELAELMGVTRFALGRWLSGQTQVRFFELLKFVELVTDRLPVLVAGWINIEEIPELDARLKKMDAAQRIAREEPWSEIILRLLEVAAAGGRTLSRESLYSAIELDPERVDQILDSLLDATLISEKKGLTATQAMSVGTEGDEELFRRLKIHWLRAGLVRLESGLGEKDLSSYNVISVSHRDLAKIRRKLIETYREVWSIVAESQPEECAAVMNVQLFRYPR